MNQRLGRLIARLKSKDGAYFPVSESKLESYQLSEVQQHSRVRQYLDLNGKKLSHQENLHIFIACRQVNWELDNLVNPWRQFGSVTHYDWSGEFDQFDPRWPQLKPIFCEQLLENVKKAHQEKPIDLFFSYLSGNWVFSEVIREIGRLGILTVNISYDDTLKFWDQPIPAGGFTGNAEIAPAFDVCLTGQASKDVAKYIYVGANPLFFPPAANPEAATDVPVEKDIPISFVGQNYGYRAELVQYLIDKGVSVQTFGHGWPSGSISEKERRQVIQRSQINLGFGYIAGSKNLVGLKERDFEVPLMGGLYLTTWNPDLAQCYRVGEEIDCYRDKGELLEKVRFYLANSQLAAEIGRRGRECVMAEHTWSKRFDSLIKLLGN